MKLSCNQCRAVTEHTKFGYGVYDCDTCGTTKTTSVVQPKTTRQVDILFCPTCENMTEQSVTRYETCCIECGTNRQHDVVNKVEDDDFENVFETKKVPQIVTRTCQHGTFYEEPHHCKMCEKMHKTQDTLNNKVA